LRLVTTLGEYVVEQEADEPELVRVQGEPPKLPAKPSLLKLTVSVGGEVVGSVMITVIMMVTDGKLGDDALTMTS